MFARFSCNLHWALQHLRSRVLGYPMGNMILLYLCIYVVQKIHPFIQFCATTATVCGKGKEGERISFSLRSVLLVPPNLLQSPPSSLLVIPKLFPWQEKPTSLGKNLQRDFLRRKQAGNLRNYVFYFLTISDVATRATLVV